MAEKDEAAVPILAGMFAIFETPDGGYHLAYRPTGADTDEHVEIPGMYVSLIRAKTGAGGLFGALGRRAVRRRS